MASDSIMRDCANSPWHGKRNFKWSAERKGESEDECQSGKEEAEGGAGEKKAK